MNRYKGFYRREYSPPSRCSLLMVNHLAGFSSGGSGFVPRGVDFDGTNDYLTRGAALTGVVDSDKGIFSCWVRADAADGTTFTLLDRTDGGESNGLFCKIARTTLNQWRVIVQNSGLSDSLFFETVATHTANATWLHILVSWDTGTTDTNVNSQIYISDVSDKQIVFNVTSGFNVDYTATDWRIGEGIGTGGTEYVQATGKMNGCLAEYYFAPGQWLDFTVEANRRKFISVSGRPVDLGPSGSLPTGTAPAVYLSVRGSEPASAFATNRGTGGDFTVTGSLDLASTDPRIPTSISAFTALQQLGLTTGLKLCLDAGDASSYSSGQSFSDLSAQASHFYRGATSGSEGSDPTFHGPPGGLSYNNYFTVDGGDYFTAQSHYAWTDEPHKDNAQWGWMYFGYSDTLGGNAVLLSTGISPGVRIMDDSGNPGKLRLQVFQAGASDALNKLTDTALTADTFYAVGVSIDEAAGATGGFFWKDGSYWQVGAADRWNPAYTTPSSSAAEATVRLMSDAGGGGGAAALSGARLGVVIMWQGYAPTKQDFDDIYNLIKSRFGL